MASNVSSFVRGKVSKSKRRYKRNGFDLDLSYITKNIIAMGFPSEGLEAKYRNPYNEVIRFLDQEHKDKYKVYNLCSERGYEPAKFYNRVGLFPFDDHNAPPFELIEAFCADVKAFMDQDPNNVAVVHCKAGKGRTGTMICAYLMYAKEWQNSDDALEFYAAMRTYNKKGVTIPSQIRYVRYFDHYLKNGMPEARTLTIERIILHGLPKFQGDIRLEISNFEEVLFTDKPDKNKYKAPKKKPESGQDELEPVPFDCPSVPACGDVKIEFTEKTKTCPGFSFWFNAAFVAETFQEGGPFRLVLDKFQLDKANKDKNHKIYPKGFQVTVEFAPIEIRPGKQQNSQLSGSSDLSGGAGSSSSLSASSGAGESGSVSFAAAVDQNNDYVEAAAPGTYSDIEEKFTSLSNY